MSKYSPSRDLDLENHTRWCVIANRAEAVIYRDSAAEQKFIEVERLDNPDGRLTDAEMGSDRPGKGISSGGKGGTIHHAFEKKNSIHEQVAKKFAAEIVRKLDEAARQDRYAELVVAAGAHFLGLLRNEYTTAVKQRVRHEISREYTQMNGKELRQAVIKALE